MARVVESKEIPAIRSTDHVIIKPDGILGCNLANGIKYFFVVGDGDSTYKSIHFKWDANIIVTLTLWGSNQPLNLNNMDPRSGAVLGTDTNEDSLTSGDWLKIDPSTAVLYTTSDDASTGGNTVTNATCVVAGGTAGGVIYDIGNVPVRRLRVRAVVGGTGGRLRCVTSGKE